MSEEAEQPDELALNGLKPAQTRAFRTTRQEQSYRNHLSRRRGMAKHQRTHFRCTSMRFLPEQIGLVTYQRIINWYKHGLIAVPKMLLKLNGGNGRLAGAETLMGVDVYTVILRAVQLKEVALREALPTELSTEQFRYIVQLWRQGYTEQMIYDKLSAPTPVVRSIITGLNRRFQIAFFVARTMANASVLEREVTTCSLMYNPPEEDGYYLGLISPSASEPIREDDQHTTSAIPVGTDATGGPGNSVRDRYVGRGISNYLRDPVPTDPRLPADTDFPTAALQRNAAALRVRPAASPPGELPGGQTAGGGLIELQAGVAAENRQGQGGREDSGSGSGREDGGTQGGLGQVASPATSARTYIPPGSDSIPDRRTIDGRPFADHHASHPAHPKTRTSQGARASEEENSAEVEELDRILIEQGILEEQPILNSSGVPLTDDAGNLIVELKSPVPLPAEPGTLSEERRQKAVDELWGD